MRWLRSTWRLRVLVALMAASLLPLAIVMPEQASLSAAAQPQADWLRAQVENQPEGAAREAFEQAIEEAHASGAQTLDDFLQAFTEAYQHQATGPSLAELFEAPDLSGEQLICYLQRRYAQVSGVAAVPRIRLTAKAASSPSLDRSLSTISTAPVSFLWSVALGSSIRRIDVRTWGCLIHILFSAQPLGP